MDGLLFWDGICGTGVLVFFVETFQPARTGEGGVEVEALVVEDGLVFQLTLLAFEFCGAAVEFVENDADFVFLLFVDLIDLVYDQ